MDYYPFECCMCTMTLRMYAGNAQAPGKRLHARDRKC